MSLLSSLIAWRDAKAKRSGQPPYYILSTATVKLLASTRPTTREEFLEIKGLGEAKWDRFGAEILSLIHEPAAPIPRPKKKPAVVQGDFLWDALPVEDVAETLDETTIELQSSTETEVEVPLSVDEYLSSINGMLGNLSARVQGEVTQVDARGSYRYFSIRDSATSALMNCMIGDYHHRLSEVALRAGDEVIVTGTPEVYKPYGKFSFKATALEYAGVGKLEAEYQRLYALLESEGLFLPENKKQLPELPARVALITSPNGAAIGDFLSNVGKHGLQITLYPALVEGKRAVESLLSALDRVAAKSEEYDVCVVIRGGGSLESLQAYNSEILTRRVAAMPLPTLCGVGHDKDITLVSLTADFMASTPTAVALQIHNSFENARHAVAAEEERLLGTYRQVLERTAYQLQGYPEHFRAFLQQLLYILDSRVSNFRTTARWWASRITIERTGLDTTKQRWQEQLRGRVEEGRIRLSHASELFALYDPAALLRRGYAVVQSGTKRVTRVSQVVVGELLEIRLNDGILEAEVKNTKKQH